RGVPAGTGTAGSPPLLYVVELAGLASGDTIRVGDGSRAEYRTITNLGGAATHAAVELPLSHAHGTAANVESVGLNLVGAAMPLDDDVARGSDIIPVQVGAAPATGITIEIRAAGGGIAEYRRVLDVQPGGAGVFLLTLDSGLS